MFLLETVKETTDLHLLLVLALVLDCVIFGKGKRGLNGVGKEKGRKEKGRKRGSMVRNKMGGVHGWIDWYRRKTRKFTYM